MSKTRPENYEAWLLINEFPYHTWTKNIHPLTIEFTRGDDKSYEAFARGCILASSTLIRDVAPFVITEGKPGEYWCERAVEFGAVLENSRIPRVKKLYQSIPNCPVHKFSIYWTEDLREATNCITALVAWHFFMSILVKREKK